MPSLKQRPLLPYGVRGELTIGFIDNLAYLLPNLDRLQLLNIGYLFLHFIRQIMPGELSSWLKYINDLEELTLRLYDENEKLGPASVIEFNEAFSSGQLDSLN